MPFFNRFDPNKLPRSRQIERTAYKDGWRHSIFNSVNDKYIGDWKEDKKTGKGVMLTRNKDLYEGDFVNNYRHGSGLLAYYLPKYNVFRLSYRGDWKNGRMHGHGIRAYPEEGFYIGYFEYGKRHGYGQMWYDDGTFYDGDWVKDKREGLGLLVRADGNRYEGSWFDDKKHGQGRFTFLNVGQLQMGVWREDVCIWSIIRNLPYRQSAKAPTLYPLPINTIVNLEEICKNDEELALNGPVESTVEQFAELENVQSDQGSEKIDEKSFVSRLSDIKLNKAPQQSTPLASPTPSPPPPQ